MDADAARGRVLLEESRESVVVLDETDRVMVSWALAAPPAPTPAADDVVASVAVPHDIEAIRRTAPPDAAAWRVRVRDEFLGQVAAGLVAAGFDDERGYLFVRP